MSVPVPCATHQDQGLMTTQDSSRTHQCQQHHPVINSNIMDQKNSGIHPCTHKEDGDGAFCPAHSKYRWASIRLQFCERQCILRHLKFESSNQPWSDIKRIIQRDVMAYRILWVKVAGLEAWGGDDAIY